MGLTLDPEAIRARLETLARYGGSPSGGVTRLVYTSEERAAAREVERWMREAGLAVRQDAVGNLFGRWPDMPGPAVWTGSHLDSVPEGGRFDGVAGVVAGLEAIVAIRRSGAKPRYPLELCVFVGEEGSRFPGGFLGSRAVVGDIGPNDLDVRDPAGTRLADAMRACGLDPARVGEACRRPGDVIAYVELHVEQGPVLDRAGVPVGAVTGIVGVSHLVGEIRGRADHAGTTPMDARADSFLGAAELALAVERCAREMGPPAVGTVGRVVCWPGAPNVVPERTEFTVDLRDLHRERLDRLERMVRASFAEILARRGLVGDLRQSTRIDPVSVPKWMVELIEDVACDVGIPTMRLPSGAGHDAMVLARVAPVGMIFVRSRGGRSHTPEEFSDLSDLVAGAKVLAGVLERLARATKPPSIGANERA